MRSILVGLCNIFSHPPSLGWGLTKGKSSRGFDSQSWIKEEKILKSTKSALLPLVNTLILKLFPGPNHSLRPAKPSEELNRLCSPGQEGPTRCPFRIFQLGLIQLELAHLTYQNLWGDWQDWQTLSVWGPSEGDTGFSWTLSLPKGADQARSRIWIGIATRGVVAKIETEINISTTTPPSG